MSKVTQEFLTNVYTTAKSTGLAQVKMITLLKSGAIDWSNDVERKNVALEFELGRMCASLGLKSRADALRVFELKPWKDGGDDSRRSDRQQKAYRAAISAWDHTAREAGMPRATLAPRTPDTKPEPAKAPEAPEASLPLAKGTDVALAMPKAVKTEDVTAFVGQVSMMLTTYQKKNGALVSPALAALFDLFRAEVAQIINGQAPDIKPKVQNSKPMAKAA